MNHLLLDNDKFIIDGRSVTEEELVATEKYVADYKRRSKLSSRKNQSKVHIISRRNGWAIVREGASKAHRVVRSKTSAIAIAKRLKTKPEIVVHTKSGEVDKLVLNS